MTSLDVDENSKKDIYTLKTRFKTNGRSNAETAETGILLFCQNVRKIRSIPSREIPQWIKICVWFPGPVLKDMALFSTFFSLSNSIYTEKRENQDSSDCRVRFGTNRGLIYQWRDNDMHLNPNRHYSTTLFVINYKIFIRGKNFNK